MEMLNDCLALIVGAIFINNTARRPQAPRSAPQACGVHVREASGPGSPDGAECGPPLLVISGQEVG